MKSHVAADQGHDAAFLRFIHKLAQPVCCVAERLLDEYVEPTADGVQCLFTMQISGSGDNHEVWQPVQAFIHARESGYSRLTGNCL